MAFAFVGHLLRETIRKNYKNEKRVFQIIGGKKVNSKSSYIHLVAKIGELGHKRLAGPTAVVFVAFINISKFVTCRGVHCLPVSTVWRNILAH